MKRLQFQLAFFLIIFLLTVQNCVAQTATSSAKTLLWRITGKGLTKPSFLYGTMHLTDKRLFMFGDEVYRSIENTQGFAIEVNPDELAAYYINNLFDEMQAKKLKDILKENEYKKYSEALSKKLKKPADKITTGDILKEKNKWMSDYMENGEMPTFVDAFMYNIARKQGKWVGGIEDLTDQTGLIDELIDKSDLEQIVSGNDADVTASIEKMITDYTNQDLDAIARASDDYDEAKKDVILINRNIKMARRMDSLSAIRSMFFAVGAAHLPGDSGVIHLLRSRGFTVEPVFSSQKTDAKLYKYKEVEQPWYDIADANNFYNVQMPGNPASLKLYGFIEMKFLFDIFSMSGYCTMAMVMPGEVKNTDSLFNLMAEKMLGSAKIKGQKTIINNGTKGKEFIDQKENAHLRLQIFVKDKTLYMVMISALKKENITSAETNRFFNSFQIKNTSANIISKQASFVDSVMGVSFNASTKLERNDKIFGVAEKNSNWKLKAYAGLDVQRNMYILLFSKETVPGTYIMNDSAFFSDVSEQLKKSFTLTNTSTFIDGHKAMFSSGKSNAEATYMQMLSVIRNNKNIALMVVTDEPHKEDPTIDSMFASFKLLPYANNIWKTYNAPDNSFSSFAPSNFIIDDEKKDLFISQDSVTVTSYMVSVDTLGKYFWITNDSAYFKEKAYEYINKTNDSLLYANYLNNGIEVLVNKDKEVKHKRIRLVLNGNILYTLITNGDKDLLTNKNSDAFFSSFKILKQHTVNVHVSKTQALLTALTSKDSATRHEAFLAIRNAPFTKQDLPVLHNALFKEYDYLYDSTSKNETYINNALAREIVALADSSSLQFIKQQYATLIGNKDYLKQTALQLLAQFKTIESYNMFCALLKQAKPMEKLTWSISNELTDSLALAKQILPTLLNFANDTITGLTIASVSKQLLDSNFITIKDIKLSENDFITVANNLLPTIKTKSNDDIDYSFYSLIDLLATYGSATSFKSIQNYLNVKDSYLKKHVAVALIKQKQKVDALFLNQIAASNATRVDFYEELKEINKQALFPLQYLTQKYFAESSVYNASTEDDEDPHPDAINFIAQKNALCKGVIYKFYLFKVSFGKGKAATHYLGVAGGYDLNGAKLDCKKDFTGIYFTDELTATNTDKLFKAFIKKVNEQTEDAEEE